MEGMDATGHERTARAIAARADATLRERTRCMLVDMDLVDPDRRRLADSFEAEVDFVVAHADAAAWRGAVVSVAPDVLGGGADATAHPAVAMAEAMLADDSVALRR